MLQKELEQVLNKVIETTNELSTIRGFIRNRRKYRNLKQGDLAELAGITQRTLNDIELEKGNPSYATIEKLLDILGYKLTPILKTNYEFKRQSSRISR